jgi:hypothetical protein
MIPNGLLWAWQRVMMLRALEESEKSVNEFVVKDSGKREDFETGARRDTRTGKGRFDLIPTMALRRLAQVYEKGAVKYGDKNWQKGQPLSRYLDSCLRHVAAAADGQEDEDHLFQAVWNLVALAWTLEEVRGARLPAALADLPYARGVGTGDAPALTRLPPGSFDVDGAPLTGTEARPVPPPPRPRRAGLAHACHVCMAPAHFPCNPGLHGGL